MTTMCTGSECNYPKRNEYEILHFIYKELNLLNLIRSKELIEMYSNLFVDYTLYSIFIITEYSRSIIGNSRGRGGGAPKTLN